MSFPSNAVAASTSNGYVKLPIIVAPSIAMLKYFPFDTESLPLTFTYSGLIVSSAAYASQSAAVNSLTVP